MQGVDNPVFGPRGVEFVGLMDSKPVRVTASFND
jgi:hypothetical protein